MSKYSIQKAPKGKYAFGRRQRRQFKNSVAQDEWFAAKLVEDSWQGKTLKDVWEDLPQMFDDLLDELPADPQDLVRVHIRSNLLGKGDIKIRMRPGSEMNASAIMDGIERVIQSNENLSISDSLELGLGVIHMPVGSGRPKVIRVQGTKSSLRSKHSIIEIVNRD